MINVHSYFVLIFCFDNFRMNLVSSAVSQKQVIDSNKVI